MNSSKPIGFATARLSIQAIALFGLLVCCGESRAQFFGQMGMQEQDILSMYLFNGQDEATHRAQVEQRCELKLTQLSEIVGLAKRQQAKLKLAIRADLNGFYRSVAAVREKTSGLDIQNQADMQKAWEHVMPLQQRLSQGLLEEGSLFEKVLDSTLSEDQTNTYQQYQEQRIAAQTKAVIWMTIADIERSIPLLSKQRKAILGLLAEVRPPKKVPEGYEAFLGYIMLTKLEDADLEQILDAAQAKAFKQTIAQYDGYQQAVKW